MGWFPCCCDGENQSCLILESFTAGAPAGGEVGSDWRVDGGAFFKVNGALRTYAGKLTAVTINRDDDPGSILAVQILATAGAQGSVRLGPFVAEYTVGVGLDAGCVRISDMPDCGAGTVMTIAGPFAGLPFTIIMTYGEEHVNGVANTGKRRFTFKIQYGHVTGTDDVRVAGFRSMRVPAHSDPTVSVEALTGQTDYLAVNLAHHREHSRYLTCNFGTFRCEYISTPGHETTALFRPNQYMPPDCNWSQGSQWQQNYDTLRTQASNADIFHNATNGYCDSQVMATASFTGVEMKSEVKLHAGGVTLTYHAYDVDGCGKLSLSVGGSSPQFVADYNGGNASGGLAGGPISIATLFLKVNWLETRPANPDGSPNVVRLVTAGGWEGVPPNASQSKTYYLAQIGGGGAGSLVGVGTGANTGTIVCTSFTASEQRTNGPGIECDGFQPLCLEQSGQYLAQNLTRNAGSLATPIELADRITLTSFAQKKRPGGQIYYMATESGQLDWLHAARGNKAQVNLGYSTDDQAALAGRTARVLLNFAGHVVENRIFINGLGVMQTDLWIDGAKIQPPLGASLNFALTGARVFCTPTAALGAPAGSWVLQPLYNPNIGNGFDYYQQIAAPANGVTFDFDVQFPSGFFCYISTVIFREDCRTGCVTFNPDF